MESAKMIYLTLENYRRLDVITRQKIGKPLAVFDVDALKEEFPHMDIPFANVGMFKGLVTRVPTGNGYTEEDMGAIPYLANYIDSSFDERGGPWLDQRKTPRELIYDFIVHHEIAHILHGDIAFIHHLVGKGKLSQSDVNNKTDKAETIRMMFEYRADKYAWSKVCPGQDMPQRLDLGISNETEKAIKNMQLVMRAHEAELYEAELKNIKPISLDPDEYVPAVHVPGGPPTFETKYIAPTPWLQLFWRRLLRR